MATDEQMAMALLALGAVALFAANNKTESKSPERAREDLQNSKRAQIQRWCNVNSARVEKINKDTFARSSKENSVPQRQDLDTLNDMRKAAIVIGTEAMNLGIGPDDPSRQRLEVVRKEIAQLYNRNPEATPIVYNVHQTVVDASTTHNESVQHNLVQQQKKLVEGDKIIELSLDAGDAQARTNAAAMEVDQSENMDKKKCVKDTQNSGLAETIAAHREQSENLPTAADLATSKSVGPSDKPRAEDETNRIIVAQGRNNPHGLHAGAANTGGEASALAAGDFAPARREVGGFGAQRGVDPGAVDEYRQRLEIERAKHLLGRMKHTRAIEAPLEANTVTFQQSEPPKVSLVGAGQRTWLPASSVHNVQQQRRYALPAPEAPPAPLLQSIDDNQGVADGRRDPNMPVSTAVVPAQPTTVAVIGDDPLYEFIKKWQATDVKLQNRPQREQVDYVYKCVKQLEKWKKTAEKENERLVRMIGINSDARLNSLDDINKQRAKALAAIDLFMEPPFLPEAIRSSWKLAKFHLKTRGMTAREGFNAAEDKSPTKAFFSWWHMSDQVQALRNNIQGVKAKEPRYEITTGQRQTKRGRIATGKVQR